MERVGLRTLICKNRLKSELVSTITYFILIRVEDKRKERKERKEKNRRPFFQDLLSIGLVD